MNVKDYLTFFCDITHSSLDLYDIVSSLKLERYLLIKISKLSRSIVKRVLLARALISNTSMIVFEEPLLEIDQESSKIIVSVIEQYLDKGTKILSTSNSFRSVTLLPGNSYLIKDNNLIPIYESLDLSLKENLNITDKNKAIIEIKVEGKMLLVNIEDILFAESIDSVTNIFVKNSYIPTQFTLEELEKKLVDSYFFRCHRSYLVNMARVSEVQQWTRNSYVLILNSPSEMEIPLSKRRYNDFKALLHSA